MLDGSNDRTPVHAVASLSIVVMTTGETTTGEMTTGETTVEVVPQRRHPVRPSPPKMPDRRVARKVGLVPQREIRNLRRVVVETTAARSRTRRLTPSVGST